VYCASKPGTYNFVHRSLKCIIKSRRMRWAGHVTRMGAMGNACRILVGKPEGKELGGPKRRWDRREIG
jgi:hypothetical protein